MGRVQLFDRHRTGLRAVPSFNAARLRHGDCFRS
jgi:hypothetical protein